MKGKRVRLDYQETLKISVGFQTMLSSSEGGGILLHHLSLVRGHFHLE